MAANQHYESGARTVVDALIALLEANVRLEIRLGESHMLYGGGRLIAICPVGDGRAVRGEQVFDLLAISRHDDPDASLAETIRGALRMTEHAATEAAKPQPVEN